MCPFDLPSSGVYNGLRISQASETDLQFIMDTKLAFISSVSHGNWDSTLSTRSEEETEHMFQRIFVCTDLSINSGRKVVF